MILYTPLSTSANSPPRQLCAASPSRSASPRAPAPSNPPDPFTTVSLSSASCHAHASAMGSYAGAVPHSLSTFLILPQALLETLLSHESLRARDLSALVTAARGHPSAPVLEAAAEAAARLLVLSSPCGRLAARARLPAESWLALLHFLHRQDGSVAPGASPTSIWSSGRNDAGQGARESTVDSNALLPTQRVASWRCDFADPPAPVIFVAAGANHSACITAYGTLQLAGSNRMGQLGLGDLTTRPAWTPVRELKWTRIAQVACGGAHSVVLTATGAVLVTGENNYGQLGTGDDKQRQSFTEPTPFARTPVSIIAAGTNHTVVLLEDGSVFATGDNANGQLGGRRDGGSHVFQPVGCFGRKVVRVACGSDTTMLLTADNMILVTGKRQFGLSVIGGLGVSRVTHLSVGEGFAIASTDERAVAVSVHRKRFYVTDELMAVDASCVSAGISHYAIATENGGALAGGANAFGQVAAGEMGLTIEGGHNARVIRPHRVPLSQVHIPPGYRVLQVAAGAFHTLFLLATEDL